MKTRKIKKDESLDEVVQHVGEEIPFQEKTEIGEAFSNLDDDRLDFVTGMSNIDFNARLSRDEIKFIKVIDELTRLGILPDDIGLTRQTKRLSVSLEGKGRSEKVQIASAGLDRQTGKAGFFKSLFQRRED